jgi:DNA-binding PadR family transcriptional regulator
MISICNKLTFNILTAKIAAMDARPLTPLSFQILVALADGPKHGYGILKEIEDASGGSFATSTGTLYLAIQRLEQGGLLEHSSGDSRRRYYALTREGREAATVEARRLASLLGVARGKKLVGSRQLEGLLRTASRKQ